jgi:hypothetical protein
MFGKNQRVSLIKKVRCEFDTLGKVRGFDLCFEFVQIDNVGNLTAWVVVEALTFVQIVFVCVMLAGKGERHKIPVEEFGKVFGEFGRGGGFGFGCHGFGFRLGVVGGSIVEVFGRGVNGNGVGSYGAGGLEIYHNRHGLIAAEETPQAHTGVVLRWVVDLMQAVNRPSIVSHRSPLFDAVALLLVDRESDGNIGGSDSGVGVVRHGFGFRWGAVDGQAISVCPGNGLGVLRTNRQPRSLPTIFATRRLTRRRSASSAWI